MNYIKPGTKRSSNLTHKNAIRNLRSQYELELPHGNNSDVAVKNLDAHG